MRVLRGSLVASVALLPGQVLAQQAVTLDEISVVSNTPVAAPRRIVTAPTASGVTRELTVLDGIDRNKVPHNTSVLTASDVNRVGFPSVVRSLDERVASISINNAQGNPFQPTITYRGFEASPLGGSPQGVAVYVNGARFNTSFGDTVQWDLIPDIAVDRIELEGSNPAFGLNALGGSLAVSLKNGFTYQGSEINLLGGSFGRGAVAFQHGQRVDNVGLYVAGNVLGERGWRKHSPSRLNQIYADLGVLAEKGEFHFNVIGASNSLTGNGTAPVELLQAKYNDVFTYPDQTKNDFLRFQLSGTYDVTPTISVQGNAYYGVFKQRTANGDAADVENCEADERFLCAEGADDEQFFLRDRTGARVRANRVRTANFGAVNPIFADRFDEGGPYAFLNQTRTDTDNFGATIQTTVRETLFGLPNRFVIGGSYDGGRTRFNADNSIGGLTLDRGFAGPGIVVSSDDGIITPVSVRSSNDYGGIYFSNVTDLTDRLTLTLQGRFNMAHIVLQDQIGTALNGDHYYQRFNPGVGLAYKVIPDYLNVYGGYSEANRAPTPAELSCADPQAPCSLTNFFVGDPPLKQVKARTVEAGIRGRIPQPDDWFGGILSYKAGFFSTRNDDDILFVPAPDTIGRAYFRNVGSTKRQGVEASLFYTTPTWSAFIDYAYVDATFQSPIELAAPGNPFNSEGGDEGGLVQVRPGNRLPGVAPHQVKFGFNYQVTPEWRIGALGRFATGKFLVGDPSNLNRTTGDYAVFGLNTSYRVTENIEIYGYVENALNRRYSTFGTFSPVDEVPIVAVPNASINRSLAPGAPIAAFGGLRILFAPPPPAAPIEPLVRKG
ncbi:TonB-dependent receptor [Methylobacterium sp. Leaf456]|uniref:TonB-dependent receptor n=1 Tax=Methylobacterium sp. Leaf456 TaxID=1736382 RepID=UPI0009E95E8C